MGDRMFQPNDEISVTMTASEWNQILAWLAEVPYKLVAPYIAKISGQGLAQAPLGNSETQHVPH